jgi:hypothetical protein
MYRANSSPAAPFALPPSVPQASSGGDGFFVKGVFYPFKDAQKIMAIACQESSASDAAVSNHQASLPMLLQPGAEYSIVEQAPDGALYQSETFSRRAGGNGGQGNNSFEQYLVAPSIMEVHPVSAMLHTPDTGSTGFQGHQYLMTEDGSMPFLTNPDEYGLPSAMSFAAEYGGSLPPSAIDPSFQSHDEQNAPTMFIAETGKHYSLNTSIGSNGSGENLSTVDPSNLTIIEHLSSDSLATDISA